MVLVQYDRIFGRIWSIYCKYKFTHKERKRGWIILVCCIFEKCHILCLFDKTKLALIHVMHLRNCDVYCNTEVILKHWQYAMITSCRSTGLMFYMIIFTRYYANSPKFSIILYGQHVVIIILTRHHTNSTKFSTMLLHIVIITHLQSTIRILPNFRL
jgi:hypothetical protein